MSFYQSTEMIPGGRPQDSWEAEEEHFSIH